MSRYTYEDYCNSKLSKRIADLNHRVARKTVTRKVLKDGKWVTVPVARPKKKNKSALRRPLPVY